MRVSEFFEPKRIDLSPVDHDRAIVGANNPPGPIEYADTIIQQLSAWMKDHPVIQTEEEAREAKPLIDRARAAQAEIEAARTNEVKPLNDKVAEINAEHKAVHNTDPKKPGKLDRVFNELKARLAAYLQAEEQRRLREAAAARAAQEEAERIAREAEAKERAALEEANAGVVDVDVAAVTEQANEAFAAFERTSRFADRAERDSKVKIGGGFAASVGLRNAEVLNVDDALKAIVVIGVTERICEAILTEARAYRKANGRLPDGVSATTERKL
jgi:hypothetical protein